jgi:CDP-diacylglycerol--glycerol-3-phosphate 3-phosphatidyltransferase
MVFITAALLPITPADLVWPAATLVMLPSLAVFLRDYLAVTRGFRKAKAKDISEPS